VLDLKSLIFHKFSIFVLSGTMSYGLKLGITAFLTEILGWWYFRSYVISLTLVILLNFFLNMYVVFDSRDRKFKKLGKYIPTVTFFFFVDALLVKFMTDIMNLYYILSIILVTTVLLVVKFVVYDKWIFRDG